jgi:tetratricopeptide (TPR) repeat protein
MTETQTSFLDVPVLLEASVPQGRVGWFWYGVGASALVVVLSALGKVGNVPAGVMELLSVLAMIGIMAAMPMMTLLSVRRYRADQLQVEGAGELVQLRRWGEAALVLDQYLSRPSKSPQLRAQALICLAAVLARYGRFDDAIVVQNHLLETSVAGGPAGFGLRLGRAMAMLQEDHLFDADRAISDLRRNGDGSGALALVEMYRDVKTGHPTEAIELFEQKLPLMREQLGHRIGDAYGLLARAYDLLNRSTEAATAFRRATLLCPVIELVRRYPELKKLVGRYEPTAGPAARA